jgi:hypothetical protein
LAVWDVPVPQMPVEKTLDSSPFLSRNIWLSFVFCTYRTPRLACRLHESFRKRKIRTGSGTYHDR